MSAPPQQQAFGTEGRERKHHLAPWLPGPSAKLPRGHFRLHLLVLSVSLCACSPGFKTECPQSMKLRPGTKHSKAATPDFASHVEALPSHITLGKMHVHILQLRVTASLATAMQSRVTGPHTSPKHILCLKFKVSWKKSSLMCHSALIYSVYHIGSQPVLPQGLPMGWKVPLQIELQDFLFPHSCRELHARQAWYKDVCVTVAAPCKLVLPQGDLGLTVSLVAGRYIWPTHWVELWKENPIVMWACLLD